MTRGMIWISAGIVVLLGAIAGVVWLLFLQRAGHAELCLEAVRVHLKRPLILIVDNERALSGEVQLVAEFELRHGAVRTDLKRSKVRCQYNNYTDAICEIWIDEKPLETAVVRQIDMAVHGRTKDEGRCT